MSKTSASSVPVVDDEALIRWTLTEALAQAGSDTEIAEGVTGARDSTMSDSQPDPNATLLRRIQSEYLEMPGLQLTLLQGRRLWGLEPAVCEALLDQLVELRFLARGPNGQFSRRSEGNDVTLPRRIARATVGGEWLSRGRKESA